MGHSRSSATSPFDRAHTTSYSTLIETMRLSCTVPFSRYLSNVADFDPPHLHLAPPHPKTRVPGLSCGIVCVILRLAVLVELRLVTDRQTDRRTDRRRQGHGQYRGCIASRRKNPFSRCLLKSVWLFLCTPCFRLRALFHLQAPIISHVLLVITKIYLLTCVQNLFAYLCFTMPPLRLPYRHTRASIEVDTSSHNQQGTKVCRRL